MAFRGKNVQREDYEAFMTSLGENSSKDMIENIRSTKGRMEESFEGKKPQEISQGE